MFQSKKLRRRDNRLFTVFAYSVTTCSACHPKILTLSSAPTAIKARFAILAFNLEPCNMQFPAGFSYNILPGSKSPTCQCQRYGDEAQSPFLLPAQSRYEPA